MDNPDQIEKTVINVKGVDKPAWEAARRGAAQTGDSMGKWLSEAIYMRGKIDAGAILSPGLASVKNGHESGNPIDLPTIANLLQTAVEAARLSGKPLPVRLRGLLHGLVDQQIRAARGMPQIPYRPRAPIHNGSTEPPTDSVDKLP